METCIIYIFSFNQNTKFADRLVLYFLSIYSLELLYKSINMADWALKKFNAFIIFQSEFVFYLWCFLEIMIRLQKLLWTLLTLKKKYKLFIRWLI